MMSRRFPARSLRACAFLALAPLFAACSEGPPPEPEAASPPSPESPEAPEAAPSAFSAELTRFEDDVAAFDGLESCKERLGSALPSSLGDLLADLRYERLVDDVCTGLAAAFERDAERCEELATHALQAGCRRRVAALLQDPSVCATRDDEPDVSCLAWSTGRAELCSGAPGYERVVCEAVARGDVRPCERATVPGVATCRALVTRHGPLEVRPPAPALVAQYEGQIVLPVGELALNADVDRGLVLRRADCIPQLVIEGRGSPRARLSFGNPSGEAELRYFDGQTILGVRAEVEVQNLVVEPHLGGRISGLVETEIELDGHLHQLSLHFETYVRNWFDSEECPAHDAPQEPTL